MRPSKKPDHYPLVAVHPDTGKYHRATCHQWDPEHDQMTEGAAIASGAEPCRLCEEHAKRTPKGKQPR